MWDNGGMISTGQAEGLEAKLAWVPLCLSQIPHELSWEWTRTFGVRSRRLPAFALVSRALHRRNRWCRWITESWAARMSVLCHSVDCGSAAVLTATMKSLRLIGATRVGGGVMGWEKRGNIPLMLGASKWLFIQFKNRQRHYSFLSGPQHRVSCGCYSCFVFRRSELCHWRSLFCCRSWSVQSLQGTKMTAFWEVSSFLVETVRRFRDAYYFHHQGDISVTMEAISTSETLVNLYQTTRHNIP
jgi:hypothetical protein